MKERNEPERWIGSPHDDRGVSEVIGVILLVAVATILAAVVGAYLLGIVEDVNANANAGVTVVEDSVANEVTVTWIEGSKPEYLVLEASGATNANTTANWSDNGLLSNVSESETFSAGGNDEVRIVVTAVDGEESTVVLDTKKQL